MNTDTKKLLKSINSGCKNATNSIEQAMSFIKEKEIKDVLEEYDRQHIQIGDKCHELLEKGGNREEDPTSMAKAMTWLSTEIKMMNDSTDSHVAELMMDGCHMGMKTVTRDSRKFKKADQDALHLAGQLINLEQDFYKRMLGFI